MRANNKSTLFVRTAAEDYIAARCCLINGCFRVRPRSAGGREDAQAYIYLRDPKARLGARERHSIEALTARVAAAFPEIRLPVDPAFLAKLSVYFEGKYPTPRAPAPACPRPRSFDTSITCSSIFAAKSRSIRT